SRTAARRYRSDDAAPCTVYPRPPSEPGFLEAGLPEVDQGADKLAESTSCRQSAGGLACSLPLRSKGADTCDGQAGLRGYWSWRRARRSSPGAVQGDPVGGDLVRPPPTLQVRAPASPRRHSALSVT